MKIEHRFSPPFCERGFRHFYHSRSFLSRFLFKKKADPSFLIQSLLFLLLAQKKETKKKALAIEKTPKISAQALNKTNSPPFGGLGHVLFLTGFRFDFLTAFFQRPENSRDFSYHDKMALNNIFLQQPRKEGAGGGSE